MSTFYLAISCLTTSNLPWFMDLVFQVPMQYSSLQHQTSLPSPATSTTGIAFALALCLHSFWSYFSTLLAYWAATNVGSSSFSVIPFCLFILFMGFSRQEYWSGGEVVEERNSSWSISNPKRWCCESAALNMPANLENSAVATGLEEVSFHSNPIER